MRKIKEVLRLHYELQLNQRQISRSWFPPAPPNPDRMAAGTLIGFPGILIAFPRNCDRDHPGILIGISPES